ncbi:MAG: preprotein translocase subunit YajC [Rhodocyclaceae bacterium]|nr:preprotein translocase subunit YajC [Rhodocyclaceae bacterium]
MLISNAYAQAAAGAQHTLGMMDFALPVIMVVAVYFLMFRPQMKKHKEHQKLVSELQKGDEVVVAGGIIGRIAKIGDNYTSVEIAKDVEIQVQKHAVSTVLPKGTLKNL